MVNAIDDRPPGAAGDKGTHKRRDRADPLLPDLHMGWIPAECREPLFGIAEHRRIITDPDQVRLESYDPSEWENLEESMDDLSYTTRALMLDDEYTRMGLESKSHAEWVSERQRKKTDPRERWSAVLANHRQRAQQAMVRSDLSLTDWLRVLAAASFECVYCGQDPRTVDHVVPLSNGGTDTPDNVVPCCKACNTSKGAKDLEVWCRRAGRDFTTIVNRINAVHVRAGFLPSGSRVESERGDHSH